MNDDDKAAKVLKALWGDELDKVVWQVYAKHVVGRRVSDIPYSGVVQELNRALVEYGFSCEVTFAYDEVTVTLIPLVMASWAPVPYSLPEPERFAYLEGDTNIYRGYVQLWVGDGESWSWCVLVEGVCRWAGVHDTKEQAQREVEELVASNLVTGALLAA